MLFVEDPREKAEWTISTQADKYETRLSRSRSCSHHIVCMQTRGKSVADEQNKNKPKSFSSVV